MRTRADARLVGAFVLGAVGLAIAAVAVLGSGRLFRQTQPFILVFRGNVNGLQVGAPVKIKGVTIGSVTEIELRLNLGSPNASGSKRGIQIPVMIEIDPKRVRDLTISRDVHRAIQEGLRAQLAMESFVTGILYIDLDVHPGSPENFEMPAGSFPQEIPTLKTTFEQAQSAAEKIISQLDKIQLDRLVNTADQTIAAFGNLARSPDIRAALLSLNQTAIRLGDTAQSIHELTEHIDRQVGPMAASIEKGADDVDIAVKKAQVSLDRLQAGLQPDAPLVYRANLALENVSAAARSLKDLSDYLQRNPSAIVRGRYYGEQ
jgi:paraquat-inducible protein B